MANEDSISSAVDLAGTVTVTWHPSSAWDEVATFREAYTVGSKVIPATFANPALAGVNGVCLVQQGDLVDALGQSTRTNVTMLCMNRAVAAQTNFENTTRDRLYFYARSKEYPADGVRFWLHPALVKNIDFE